MAKPPRSTIHDFDPAVLRLFDQYVHGLIDRRGFLRGATRFAAGAGGAAGLLAALSPQFAAARQVSPDDARLSADYLEFDSPQGYGKGRGYLAKPTKPKGPLPVVLVVHENRGLNPHIEDIARRLALEGGNGRLGVVGFCYGGAIANFLATRLPNLAAAAPFYGGAPRTEDVAAIQAELLVVLAADDERVNAAWPDYEKALKAAGVRYRLLQPPGTQHGFNNDTTPRYDQAAAKEAWDQTLALFKRTLGEVGRDS